MSDIRYCGEHGYFNGERCQNCRQSGTHILSGSKRTQVSKFLSGALRHFPEDVGLELDRSGWVEMETVVNRTQNKYGWIDEQAVEAIIQTDPKGRFEVDETRIRAAYGHSVDVDLESGGTPVPDSLYHGTSPENLSSICEDGLQSMSRQQVHLTESATEARTVGRRHATDPVLLRIDAAQMLEDDRDITKRGKSVYTTEHVPPTYITHCE